MTSLSSRCDVTCYSTTPRQERIPKALAGLRCSRRRLRHLTDPRASAVVNENEGDRLFAPAV